MWVFNIVIVLSSLLTYFIASRFGVDWIKIIPGILLLYYLPGHNFNSILFRKRDDISKYFRLSLDLLSSISILFIGYFILRNYINYFESRLAIYVYVVNIILAIASHIINKNEKVDIFIYRDKKILILFLLPIILFIIKIILNPYIFEIDSLIYFKAFNEIIQSKVDYSPLFKTRETFPFLITSTYYLAGLSYIGIFKYFMPLVFYISSGVLFSLLINQKRRVIFYLAYLLILASPILIIMNEGVRPETINIALTIPILVLSYLSIKNNDIILMVLMMLYSLVSFRTHEFGLILLFIALVAVLIIMIRNLKKIYQFITTNLLLILSLLLSLMLICKQYSDEIFINLKEGLAYKTLISVINPPLPLKWRLWFLDNAKTIWGADISWAGYKGALLYYLYHGLIPFVFLVCFVVIYISLKRSFSSIHKFVPLLPCLMFFVIHITIAEILPRAGIVLMFDRSWPYIAMSGTVLSIIIIVNIYSGVQYLRFNKLILLLISFSIVTGIIGAIIGSTFMGGMVSRYESGAIENINNLPKDSVILSTQRNQNLVRIYTDKTFYQISPKTYNDNNFINNVMTEYAEAKKEEREDILDSINVERLLADVTNQAGIKINETTKTVLLTTEEKMTLLERYNPTYFNYIKQRLNEVDEEDKDSVYFLYSYAKIDHGILGTREWWLVSSDVNNYRYFKNYDKNTLSRDNNYILIKIN